MKKNIKVLMVGSDTSVKGGMTTVVQSFLNYSKNSNFKLMFIPTHIETDSQMKKISFFLSGLLSIFFQLLFNRVDIVHMHMSERGSFSRKFIIFKLSKLFNKRVITHTHGAEFKEYYNESNSKVQSNIRKLLKESDKVITLGENWNDIIKSIEPQTKTLILRNSVILPKKINTLNSQEINVLFLAVLINRKGIIDLINSSYKVIKELEKEGKSIKFLIAGDGPLLESSINLTKELGIAENFEFLGWIDVNQKEQLLTKTDLFVLPSYNEGLPLSILEALSYGIPVVSTHVGSVNEAVIDGKNGFLINPGNVESLSKSMLNILQSNDFQEMGRQSRLLAEDHFNSEKYFEIIEDLYASLMNTKNI
ncbi:glycosyltransferase [Neobacillus cucumis]|uniref:glycosyltransferase n=1 Tax=Neobacillus cucumis TaxID=1740721 RepID=UPI002041F119|nr:glycosyltransferase [Neobacillus cucumis]MCM3729098.1 glycosyltransferase [Neobacillus cucumis]